MSVQEKSRAAGAIALAMAVALALGTGTAAQAQQYRYPASASSSPYRSTGTLHPVRARGAAETNYRHQSPRASQSGNASMRPGEACPPGSPCAPGGSTGGSGRDGASNGYGGAAHYRYGASAAREAQPARPADNERVAVSRPSVVANNPNMPRSPSQAGYGNHQQSSLPNLTPSSSGNPFSDANGPGHRPDRTLGGPTGPVGITTGQQMLGNTPVGGHRMGSGQQTTTPSFVGSRNNITQKGQTSPVSGLGKASGGGPHQGVSSSGMNLQNGGTAGASESLSEMNQRYNPFSGNGVTKSDYGSLTWKKGKPWNGTDSSGQTWQDGKPGKLHGLGTGSQQTNEGKAAGEGVNKLLHTKLDYLSQSDSTTNGNGTGSQSGTANSTPDPNINYGAGSPVSGTGQVVNPKNGPKGTDIRGGRGNAGPQGNGSLFNANGRVNPMLTGEAVDVNKKPPEKGVVKVNYNGKLGATDPKKDQTTGGH